MKTIAIAIIIAIIAVISINSITDHSRRDASIRAIATHRVVVEAGVTDTALAASMIDILVKQAK